MITKVKYIFCAVCLIFCSFSCSDILETESTRQNIEPTIAEKTDSVFYAFGILQAMQQLADQYVMQGEMRGDLVKTTVYTDSMLTQLANFSATTKNKYDSAYVYYRVINNCNYYIAHCDTNLYNGSTNVVIDKYVAAKAIRAWAYLQLGRNYERVPFFTEPLTQISQIDRGFAELSLEQMVAQLAPDLERYTGFKVPTLGYTSSAPTIGSPNWESTAKAFMPSKCFVPVDVVLGDLYLETGDYAAAARHYITYLTKVSDQRTTSYFAPLASKRPDTGRFALNDDELPDRNLFSYRNYAMSDSWSPLFGRNNINDIITYIPMATTAQNGQTTQLPLIFGFDYYATPEEKQRSGAPYVDEVQLLPSDALNLLSDSTEFYYYASYTGQTDRFDSVRIAHCGDMRLRSIMHQEVEEDSTLQWMTKFNNTNIVLYRTSTIWLRLAEAFNRLGMPDVAFAILKDGISENILSTNADGSYQMSYISDDSRSQLQGAFPLLSKENIALFPKDQACGIHAHGTGQAAGDLPNLSETGGTVYHTGKSPYQLDRMVGLKLQELNKALAVGIGTTKQDTINAVEDLICDELALETAFEGNRYFDLLRLARHKNAASPDGYPANFGWLWMKHKLAGRGWDESKQYLPFK